MKPAGVSRHEPVEAEAQAIDLRLHEAWEQVAVASLGDLRVGVAEQLLDRDQLRPQHEQHARVGVPEIVEPHLPDLSLRPELETAARAGPDVREVAGILGVCAATVYRQTSRGHFRADAKYSGETTSETPVVGVLVVWLNAGMHWTLHPTKGLALAVVCLLAAGVFAWISQPFPIAQLLLGAVAGAVIGALQRRSLREAPATFRATSTTADVRRAMSGTKAGKAAILGQYVAAAVLVAVSVLRALAQTEARPSNPVIGAAAGYLLLVFVRDVVALPAVRELHKA